MADMTNLLGATSDGDLRPMAVRRSILSTSASSTSSANCSWSLTRKELTVRYKHSALGFLWSMVQPLFLLVVYTAVFAILGAGFPASRSGCCAACSCGPSRHGDADRHHSITANARSSAR
jgi:hypothetical protein